MPKKFKDYNQNQGMLLPPNLIDMIPEKDPVLLIDSIINKLDFQPLLDKFPGGGAPSFHPLGMFKVLVYAYLNNIYSSRKIEVLCRQNINYMFLIGMQRPDHNTVNRFRGNRLDDVIKPIFKQVVLMLSQAGLISVREIYTDGTKIEANANRYTFVWKKSLQTRKKKILEQIDRIWDYAIETAKKEMHDIRPRSFEEVTPELITETVKEINSALKDASVDPEIKKKLKYAEKNWVQQLKRNEEYESQMGCRNSSSKTDPDATFMRMKDDHMKNGQTKPAYNVQISTNGRAIVDYTIHQTPGDTVTFKDHIEDYKSLYNKYPETVTADAGYGSEENYLYAENNDIDAYVKYNTFHIESTEKWLTDISKQENLYYNAEKDVFYCPMGQQMSRKEEYEKATSTGFKQTITVYQAKNCTGCPLRGACHKSAHNRVIEVNHQMRRLRKKAREKLTSEEGIKKRKRRCIEPETVFGNIKQNKKFTRFNLRGLKKVAVEFGLVALTVNLARLIA